MTSDRDDLAIEARGLVKIYGDQRALDGFDLTVRAGTVCGLLGPNGAGKTTAVRILATLLRPDGGSASVAGVDVVAAPLAVKRRIGLSGQEPAVDEILSGRQNLVLFGRLNRLSRRAAERRADELLARLGLADAADRAVKHYSGGMRRRLDLAVTLILAPRVLFLDEPTTGLDPRNRREVWAAIRELVAGGTTVLLTTQYLDEADQLADRVVVIDAGRVIAEGTPAELKARIGGDRHRRRRARGRRRGRGGRPGRSGDRRRGRVRGGGPPGQRPCRPPGVGAHRGGPGAGGRRCRGRRHRAAAADARRRVPRAHRASHRCGGVGRRPARRRPARPTGGRRRRRPRRRDQPTEVAA